MEYLAPETQVIKRQYLVEWFSRGGSFMYGASAADAGAGFINIIRIYYLQGKFDLDTARSLIEEVADCLADLYEDPYYCFNDWEGYICPHCLKAPHETFYDVSEIYNSLDDGPEASFEHALNSRYLLWLCKDCMTEVLKKYYANDKNANAKIEQILSNEDFIF